MSDAAFRLRWRAFALLTPLNPASFQLRYRHWEIKIPAGKLKHLETMERKAH